MAPKTYVSKFARDVNEGELDLSTRALSELPLKVNCTHFPEYLTGIFQDLEVLDLRKLDLGYNKFVILSVNSITRRLSFSLYPFT